MSETNTVLDQGNDLLNSLLGYGEKAVGLYSSFLDAQIGYKLGQAQLANVPNSGSYAPEQEDVLKLGGANISASKVIIFGAIALAIAGTGLLLYKSIK